MSYKSKRALTGMIASLALLIAYGVYALNADRSGDDLRGWAWTILAFIGISVAATIVVQILFHIALATAITVRHPETDADAEIAAAATEDEMDRLIALRASQIGYACSGIGVVGALAALGFGVSAVLALHLIFAGFAIGALASAAVTVHGYERGVRNA